MQLVKPTLSQLLRAAAGASLAAVLGTSLNVHAQNAVQPAPTATPQGARGETPHYPASGVAGQGATPMQGASPAGDGVKKPHTRKSKGARGENPHYPAPGMPGQGGSAAQGN
ncbi:MAG: hypothetical protein V4764_03365 [Burkholderia sp.]